MIIIRSPLLLLYPLFFKYVLIIYIHTTATSNRGSGNRWNWCTYVRTYVSEKASTTNAIAKTTASFIAAPIKTKKFHSVTASSIQVIVWLRPRNETKKMHGTLPVITASTHDKCVTIIKGSGTRQARTSYTFDHVFTAFSSQDEVFQEILKPVIGDIMNLFRVLLYI